MSAGHLTHESRGEIQAANGCVSELARKFNVSRATVRRWKQRESARNKPRERGKTARVLSPCERVCLLELRRIFSLSLSQLHLLGNSLLEKEFSRATLHRLLERHGLETLGQRQCMLGKSLLPEGYTQWVLPFRFNATGAKREFIVSFFFQPSDPEYVRWRIDRTEEDADWAGSVLVQPRISPCWWYPIEQGKHHYNRNPKFTHRLGILNLETILRVKELEEACSEQCQVTDEKAIKEILKTFGHRLERISIKFPKGFPRKLVPFNQTEALPGIGNKLRHAS
jgi:hypothetical protein